MKKVSCRASIAIAVLAIAAVALLMGLQARRYVLGGRLMEGARSGDAREVNRLLDAGADPNWRAVTPTSGGVWACVLAMIDRSRSETYPLMAAIDNDNDDAAIALIRRGANVNARCWTVFHASLYMGAADVGHGYRAPLGEAAKHGSVRLVRALLAAHADPHARCTFANGEDINESSVEDIATTMGRPEAADVLRQAAKQPAH